MINFYVNDIPNNNEIDKKLDRDELIKGLNSGDYTIHETIEEAKLEAKMFCTLAWALFDSPVITYNVNVEENSESLKLIDYYKVGEITVENDSEGMTKDEILKLYNINSEGDLND